MSFLAHWGRVVLLSALLAPSACSSSNDSTSGVGGGGGSGATGGSGGGASCATADTSCPAEHPHPGGPCNLTDSCDYPDVNGTDTWTYSCVAGRWSATSSCATFGDCPTPPLAETCKTPFAGSVSGATVEIGPIEGAFTPFQDGQAGSLIYGSQGSPMLAYRVRISGVNVPDCLRLDATVSVNSTVAPPATSRVTMHCEESLAVYAVLPYDDALCNPGSFDVGITVEVQGVGTASATLKVDSPGGCLG